MSASTIRMPLQASATAMSWPLSVSRFIERSMGTPKVSRITCVACAPAVCSGPATACRMAPGRGTAKASTAKAGKSLSSVLTPSPVTKAPTSVTTAPACHAAWMA